MTLPKLVTHGVSSERLIYGRNCAPTRPEHRLLKKLGAELRQFPFPRRSFRVLGRGSTNTREELHPDVMDRLFGKS